MNKIITIGREFGSGGREFGRRLAEKLGYQYYDKEIIERIAKETDLDKNYVDSVLESNPATLMPITIGHSMIFTDNYQISQIQKVYSAQMEILKSLAEKSNCVIIGRCADYILRDYHPYKIFVYADLDSRIKRCLDRQVEGENLTEKKARKMIKKIDKNRANYYNYYTAHTWGDKSNYDLCINTTNTNIKDIVEIIAKIFE